jgi:hypothetical protein
MGRLIAVVILSASFLGAATVAGAQNLPPHNYAFDCHGRTVSDTSFEEVGVIQFTSSTSAAGSAEIDINLGATVEFSSFTAVITNGTANARGTGGNGIPQGCFKGTATWSPNPGMNTAFFGCYNETAHGFDWVQTASSGGTLTCKGLEM